MASCDRYFNVVSFSTIVMSLTNATEEYNDVLIIVMKTVVLHSLVNRLFLSFLCLVNILEHVI